MALEIGGLHLTSNERTILTVLSHNSQDIPRRSAVRDYLRISA